MSEDREGFLSRWSRRKREAVAEEPPAAPAPAPELPPVVDEDPGATEPRAPECAACPIPNLPEIDLASLPRIEDLTAESDFTQFLRPGIPTLLRNAALRRMWSLDPAIRDYIGPVDYQWDFNTPGGLPFGFSNELGGDVGKLLAQAIGKIEELAGEEPAPAEPGLPAEPPATASEPDPEPPALLAGEPGPEPVVAPVETAAPEPVAPRRRHGRALPA